MMNILDVVDLMNALFKVNLKIAHDECFIKIQIPDESNWWYGWKRGVG